MGFLRKKEAGVKEVHVIKTEDGEVEEEECRERR